MNFTICSWALQNNKLIKELTIYIHNAHKQLDISNVQLVQLSNINCMANVALYLVDQQLLFSCTSHVLENYYSKIALVVLSE